MCDPGNETSLVDSSANSLQTFSIQVLSVHQYKTSNKSLMSGDPDIWDHIYSEKMQATTVLVGCFEVKRGKWIKLRAPGLSCFAIAMTTGQPSALNKCTSDTKYLSHTPGSCLVCAVRTGSSDFSVCIYHITRHHQRPHVSKCWRPPYPCKI